MKRTRALAVFAVTVLAPALASTQSTLGYYERLYGTPVDVPLTDLINQGSFYTGRAVRTDGRLASEMFGAGQLAFALEDAFGAKIKISPKAEIAGEFGSEARFRTGREFRLTGVLTEAPPQVQNPGGQLVLEFWAWELAPDRALERLAKAKGLSIADLVASPSKHDGKVVRVAGSFRGRNLFGDLPDKSQRNRTDWVLEDEKQAIWVTSRKPKGPGWELDPSLKRDTGKWIEVVGTATVRNGVIYVKAEKLALVPAPQRPEKVADLTPTPTPKPKVPPVVVFALPLDGETEVPSDSRFVVQFSKDMDETSFKDKVVLRYIGPPRAGVRPLDSVTLAYDAGRKALTVDPGDRLRRGLELELRLLSGIKDVDGMSLVPRRADPGRAPEDELVDTLRYRVGT